MPVQARCLALFVALIAALPSIGLADAKLDVNPLLTFRAQMEALRRDCAKRGWDENCQRQRKLLKDNLVKLRDVCKEDPDDERCGAIMTEKKDAKSTQEVFCQQNPHELRCVKKRENSRRREKIKRKFCSKNPDAKRCEPRIARQKGAGTFLEYCKLNPDKPRCIKWMEQKNRNAPPASPDANTF